MIVIRPSGELGLEWWSGDGREHELPGARRILAHPERTHPARVIGGILEEDRAAVTGGAMRFEGDDVSVQVGDDGVRVVEGTPDGPRTRFVGHGQIRHATVAAFTDRPDVREPQGLELIVGYVPRDDDLDGDVALERLWLGFATLKARFPVDAARNVVALAEEIRAARVRHQRSRLPHRDLTSPPRGANGVRPDVEQAAARCTRGLTASDVTVVSDAAREDEYVLEMSPTKGVVLVVLTTLRVFVINRVNRHDEVTECPIDAVVQVAPTDVKIPGQPCIAFTRGSTRVWFVLESETEAHRLVGGARFALDLACRDDALRPASPTTAELFTRWQALRQASELATLDPDVLADLAQQLFIATRSS